jgi:xanthosine utilization system XapX-like protein
MGFFNNCLQVRHLPVGDKILAILGILGLFAGNQIWSESDDHCGIPGI